MPGIKFSIEKTRPNLESLYNTFKNVKKGADDILSNYNDNNFLKDPSVNVESIAKSIGIKGIFRVKPIIVQYDHSHLIKEFDIILLNKYDSKEEQCFSIAHEICHFKNIDTINIFNNENTLEDKVARSDFTSYYADTNENTPYIINYLSRVIIDFILNTIGINVSMEKAEMVIDKIYNKYSMKNIHETDKKNIEWVKIVYEATNKLIKEEIADYFAANLLIPTERFLLWKDKSEKKIARAFGVNIECIKKRREEVKYELDFLLPESFSSDINIEKLTPVSA